MNKFHHASNEMFLNAQEALKLKKPFVITLVVTFFVMLLISFFDVATSQTVFSLSLSEYSVEQIADRTIVAEFTLEATAQNDVSVTVGEEIIRKGFPITEEQYEKLKLMAETPTYVDSRALFNACLFFVLFACLVGFLFSKKILGRELKLKEAIFFAATLVIVYGVTIIAKKMPAFSNPFALTMIIPASFCIMLVTIMFGSRIAAFTSFFYAFAVLFASDFAVSTSIYILSTCFFSVYIVKKANTRIQLTLVAITLAIINPICIVIVETIFAVTLPDVFMNTLGTAINGFVSGICILGFLTPLEYICNTASVFRLLDLSDLNNPLMQRMLINAPGTYNHSMLVATLAETACNEIGANGLLARVGAYYHDIGKLEQPEYFVENQRDGNKHDDINPRLSVSVIRNHVKKGVERCNQLHLPEEVVDVVAQHHGNSTIYYFFNEARKIDPDVSEGDFSYMGTTPRSKEAAVVMICDTVEAACRTLKEPSVSRLNTFIRKLIIGKFEAGQMDSANLTFDDLNRIQQALVNIMAGYYHSRIEYPNQEDPEPKVEPKAEAQKVSEGEAKKIGRKKQKEAINGE